MKSNALLTSSLGIILLLSVAGRIHAQTGIFRRMAINLVEQVAKKGGREAAEEIARIGGERAAEELLERAAKEGGHQLAEKLAREATEHGAVILRGAKESPARFVKAFEELAPNLRAGALQAVSREPELMSGLVSQFGREALEIGAKHPGVGASLMKTFGREGVEVVQKLSRDEAIQMARLSSRLASVPAPQRSQLFKTLAKAPGKVIDLLEKNPKVLMTAAGLTAFLASKDQILGSKPVIVDPDGTVRPAPGLAEKIAEMFKKPFSAVIGVIGAAIAGLAAIKLWASYRISRVKVILAERQARAESRTPASR